MHDACVLYPAPLRDLLMHVALTDLYRAKWTETVHDEWMRNLLRARPDLKPEQLQRTRESMNAHVRDSLVRDYEVLIDSVTLPDPGDRHVLAAAIKSSADVILKFNLKHFPDAALKLYCIKAQHPDEFLAAQFDIAPNVICLAAQRHRASLKNPPRNVDEYLATLAMQRLPQTADRLRTFAELIGRPS